MVALWTTDPETPSSNSTLALREFLWTQEMKTPKLHSIKVWICTLSGQCLCKFDISGRRMLAAHKTDIETVSTVRTERQYPNVAKWPKSGNFMFSYSLNWHLAIPFQVTTCSKTFRRFPWILRKHPMNIVIFEVLGGVYEEYRLFLYLVNFLSWKAWIWSIIQFIFFIAEIWNCFSFYECHSFCKMFCR